MAVLRVTEDNRGNQCVWMTIKIEQTTGNPAKARYVLPPNTSAGVLHSFVCLFVCLFCECIASPEI